MKYYLVLATVFAVCSWVSSDANYYKIDEALGEKCKSRVGATDSDVEVLATHQPIKTEVQKKLAHCIYQTKRIICGDELRPPEHLTQAYVIIHDGDPPKFKNITWKLQQCYNAGMAFNRVDGLEVIYLMYNCFLEQWIQDEKNAVSSDGNYYKISMALGEQCKSRVGASNSDVEVVSTYQPIKTEVQKKLAHCVSQKLKIICGDNLRDIDYLTRAYVILHDGDLPKFKNVTAKIQECYNAGKALDGEDGVKVVVVMYNCFRKQWNQDKKNDE